MASLIQNETSLRSGYAIRTHIAGFLKRSGFEVTWFYGECIPVSNLLTRYLAEHNVVAFKLSHHECRTSSATRQVGEWERNHYNVTLHKSFQASSSGLSQSLPKEYSLAMAVASPESAAFASR